MLSSFMRNDGVGLFLMEVFIPEMLGCLIYHEPLTSQIESAKDVNNEMFVKNSNSIKSN